MKAKYLLVALVAAFVSSGLAFAKPVRINVPDVCFDVPADVLKYTTPDPSTLPIELTAWKGVTYSSMKGELAEKVLFRRPSFLSVLNNTGTGVLFVVNGHPVFKGERDNGPLGIVINGSERVVAFDWFEKYGDMLIIGMFPVEAGNVIRRGNLVAIHFADLIDSEGNLRRLKMMLDGSLKPLSEMRLVYFRPRYNNVHLSPVVALKPGAKPLVIKTAPMLTIPNVGPVVEMPTFLVKATDEQATVAMAKWMRLDLTIEKGEVIRREVLSVAEGSPYADAGLKPGMFIWTISAPEIDPAFAGSVWPYRDIELVVTDSAAVASRLVLSAERIRHALSAQMGKTLAAATP